MALSLAADMSPRPLVESPTLRRLKIKEAVSALDCAAANIHAVQHAGPELFDRALLGALSAINVARTSLEAAHELARPAPK